MNYQEASLKDPVVLQVLALRDYSETKGEDWPVRYKLSLSWGKYKACGVIASNIVKAKQRRGENISIKQNDII